MGSKPKMPAMPPPPPPPPSAPIQPTWLGGAKNRARANQNGTMLTTQSKPLIRSNGGKSMLGA